MRSDYRQIIEAIDTDRRVLFFYDHRTLGTAVQHIEKDFWVCWALDALFNGVAQPPRILFKGGTYLLKAFSLMTRFSEDIDITAFKEDLGQPFRSRTWPRLGGRSDACGWKAFDKPHKHTSPAPCVNNSKRWRNDQMPEGQYRIELDPANRDNQTILFWYPAVTADDSAYIRSQVKIEAGAKSALDPL